MWDVHEFTNPSIGVSTILSNKIDLATQCDCASVSLEAMETPRRGFDHSEEMAARTGFEPATLGLRHPRSVQLSYRAIIFEPQGLLPLGFSVLSHYFRLKRALFWLWREPCIVVSLAIKDERSIGL